MRRLGYSVLLEGAVDGVAGEKSLGAERFVGLLRGEKLVASQRVSGVWRHHTWQKSHSKQEPFIHLIPA